MENRKSAEKEYSPILSMSKKSPYEKAIEHFKLRSRNATTIASSLKIKINKSFKPSNEPASDYAKAVKVEIVKKWKDATQVYLANYKMSFRVFDKKKKVWKDSSKEFSVKGTKDTLTTNAHHKFNSIKRNLEEKSPDTIDPASFEYGGDDELIPYTETSGIVVENHIVESSLSGGQRTIGKKGAKRYLKMKKYMFKLDGEEEQEWDTKTNRCVFDWLIYKYKDIDGYKKCMNYEYLNDMFATSVEPDEFDDECNLIQTINNPLVEGVSIKQLELFCEKFHTAMYAYDMGDELIEIYNPKSKTKTKGEALIFRCFNEHFYPITDKHTRKIKIGQSIGRGINYKSIDIDVMGSGKAKERKEKTIISPTEEQTNAYKSNGSDVAYQNQFAIDYIRSNGNTIPFPLTDKNVSIEENRIQRLIFDDKVILTRPIDPYVKTFMEKEGLDYQGESYVAVLNHIWKLVYPFEITTAPFVSRPNPEVLKCITADNVKWRTHFGRTTDAYSSEDIISLLQQGKAVAIDINKCYSDCLYNQQETFIVFNGKEIIEPFKYRKDLKLGLYFVETADMTLFHKSNWYSRRIIQVGLKNKIRMTITHQILVVDETPTSIYVRPNIPPENLVWTKPQEEGGIIKYTPETHIVVSPSCLFKDFIDNVVELTEQDEDFTLTKRVINSLTGYFGKTDYIQKLAGLSTSLKEIWCDFVIPEAQLKADVFVVPIDKDLYLFGYENRIKMLSTSLPMYIQILDWSNIALYEMGKKIGGEIIFRKTDCIVSIGGKNVIPNETPCDFTDTFGTYKQVPIEEAITLAFDRPMTLDRAVESPVMKDVWIDYPEYDTSSDWEKIIKLAIDKGGLLVSGRAGTGKSFIIEKGVEAKLLPEEKTTRLSFTNRASRNINGTTIHKALAINDKNNCNNKTMISLKKYNTFIVDEVSMLNADLWNKLVILKKETKATFIILGDYRQCPPIEDGKEMDYFQHPYMKFLANNNRIELTTPQRYDLELWDWLEKFYENGIVGNAIEKKKLDMNDILYRKNLCYLNATRKEINELCMEHLKDDIHHIKLEWLKVDESDKQDTAYIYNGLPVMAIVNNTKMEIINSEEFWVKSFCSTERTIVLGRDEDMEDEIVIGFDAFHKNFVVNYCATTHKSQGATISKDINIFDWDIMKKDRKIAYTAVSRGKTCKQITIVDEDE